MPSKLGKGECECATFGLCSSGFSSLQMEQEDFLKYWHRKVSVIHNKSVITYDKSVIKVNVSDMAQLVACSHNVWEKSQVQVLLSVHEHTMHGVQVVHNKIP